MITDEQVRHVAKLARIELKDDEVAVFREHFEKILDYFGMLDSVEENIEPAFHVLDICNVFRDDVPGECLNKEEVMANAPKTEKGYFRGPRIV